MAAPDLQALQRQAQKEGVPLQSLMASIIHQHVREQLGEYLAEESSAADESSAFEQGQMESGQTEGKKPLSVSPPRKG